MTRWSSCPTHKWKNDENGSILERLVLNISTYDNLFSQTNIRRLSDHLQRNYGWKCKKTTYDARHRAGTYGGHRNTWWNSTLYTRKYNRRIYKNSSSNRWYLRMGISFFREEFRGQWLSYTLIESILTTYHDRALMCVTNVPQVIQTCWRLAQIEIQAHEMKKSILEIIESWQPLLEDDHIFWNRHFIERVKV